MCNDYRLIERVPAETLFPYVLYPEGIPNFEPREDIRITDRAPDPARRRRPGRARSSWCSAAGPGPGRAASRSTISAPKAAICRAGRCVILADGFYEFTAHTDPKSKRKHKWLFTLTGQTGSALPASGVMTPTVGEAFTMLTIEPHADVAPYHNRGIALLSGATTWPAGSTRHIPSREVLKPLPAGSLTVTQISLASARPVPRYVHIIGCSERSTSRGLISPSSGRALAGLFGPLSGVGPERASAPIWRLVRVPDRLPDLRQRRRPGDGPPDAPLAASPRTRRRAIRPRSRAVLGEVTFADDKAGHLVATLGWIGRERPDYDLSFLKDRPVHDALAWLERLPGVGQKVAAATLNASTLRDARVHRRQPCPPHPAAASASIGPRADARDGRDAVTAAAGALDADGLLQLFAALKRLGQTPAASNARPAGAARSPALPGGAARAA